MSPLPRQGWLFLIEFLKWYFSKYQQVQTMRVFAQTVTYYAQIFMQNAFPTVFTACGIMLILCYNMNIIALKFYCTNGTVFLMEVSISL